MAGFAECLLVVVSIRTKLAKWDDVIHFQIGFRIWFKAFEAGVVISFEDAEAFF
jgi:hypothetical protein